MRSTIGLISSILGLGALACIGDVRSDEGTQALSQAGSGKHGDTVECKPKHYGGSNRFNKLINNKKYRNHAGKHATYSTLAPEGERVDTHNAFFDDSLGTNGRACVHCHMAEDGWGVSAANVKDRFEESCGTDPIFREVDGTNSNRPLDTSTLEAKRAAYSMLLDKGLIRIQLPIPANAQFTLVGVDDPHNNDLTNGIVVYRRPLPATNLKFTPITMWDGRANNLTEQARTATLGHAQAAASPTDAQLQEMVDFETSLFTTQVENADDVDTDKCGGQGDPVFLSNQVFVPHQNRDMSKISFDGNAILSRDVFTIFNAWKSTEECQESRREHREAVLRGQKVFEQKEFFDPIGPPFPKIITCANCHMGFNSGTFSGPRNDAERPFSGFTTVQVSAEAFRTPDLPLYTFKNKTTGALVKSTDPGMALRTGLFRDISRFKSVQLRGLASHAPYFHNGSAATLGDVVDHYDRAFGIGFTAQERSDLITFLGSL